MTAPATNSTPTPPCPKCGGAVWDQQGSKFWGNGLFKSGKQKPRWECKNKECGGAVWEKASQLPKPSAPKTERVLANVPDSQLPEGLGWGQVEREEAQDLSKRIGFGFDVGTIQKDLAMYQAMSEFVLREIAPLYEKAKIGMSPESAAACVQTLFINTTGGKK